MVPPPGSRVFPDDRSAFRYFGGTIRSAEGSRVTVYADQAATVLASIVLLGGTTPAGSALVVGPDSLIPEFWETTGLTVVWALTDGASATYRLDSRLVDRVAAVEAAVAGGGTGGFGGRYEHHQNGPATSWVILHGLGYPPAFFAVTDSAGSQVDGDVASNGATQSVLSFSAPFSGTAVVS